MTPDDIAATRKNHNYPAHFEPGIYCEPCRLLAHIDTLTAAVEALPHLLRSSREGWQEADLIDRAAVRAILNGETPTPAR